jgi:hypothetical protein
MPSYGQLTYESPNQHEYRLWRSASLGSGNGTSLEMLMDTSASLRHICYIANAPLLVQTWLATTGITWYNLVNKGTQQLPATT